MSSRLHFFFAPLLVAACAGGAFLGWQAWQSGRTVNALREVVQTVDMEALLHGQSDSNDVSLALRGISLSEGEDGSELWRLKAEWATIRQEAALVDLNMPHVLYRMGQQAVNPDNPASYLDVTGQRGQLSEENARISLRGEVRAEHDRHVLTGPQAYFVNSSRTLTFPEGAKLNGPTLSGSADVLRWDVSFNRLLGQGHVVMILHGKGAKHHAAPAGSMTVEELDASNAVPSGDAVLSAGDGLSGAPLSATVPSAAEEQEAKTANTAADNAALKEQTL